MRVSATPPKWPPQTWPVELTPEIQADKQPSRTRSVAPKPIVGNTALPVLIDGSKSPGSVPDELAYKLFILSTLPPTEDTKLSLKLRQLRMAKLGFDASDQETYLRIVKVAANTINKNTAKRNALAKTQGPSVETRAAMKMLKNQDEHALDYAKKQLDTLLTPEARQRFESYIQNDVKTKVKIYHH
jgi:hypothetical protein